jgi:hypothetical protein
MRLLPRLLLRLRRGLTLLRPWLRLAVYAGRGAERGRPPYEALQRRKRAYYGERAADTANAAADTAADAAATGT